MEKQKKEVIDHGKTFDFGNTSRDYARYRDIYPPEFYQRILDLGLCREGQKVLDLGTGTGVLPRNLYRYGAEFTGTDLSENQIKEARRLAEQENMKINFQWMPAEKSDFPDRSFDVITACQCFSYFNHSELAPKISHLLNAGGRFAILYMAWLPFEDVIAGKSEELVLRYNPLWTGCREERHPIVIPESYDRFFVKENEMVFDLSVPFTRESWNGRMKSCRGIGASLTEAEVDRFDREHLSLLKETAPECFEILHYAAITVLRRKEI